MGRAMAALSIFMPFNIVFSTTLLCRHYYPHLKYEQTEAQSVDGSSMRSSVQRDQETFVIAPGKPFPPN